MSVSPHYLSEQEVRRGLRMPESIEAVERARVEFSAGKVRQPVRTVFEFGAERSFFGLMPAYVPSLPALGAKNERLARGGAVTGCRACSRDTLRGATPHVVFCALLTGR
jgi:hypothetical protein